MRVVYLLTFLDSQTGGMERQALQLAQRLRNEDCNIFFVTCARISRMRKEKLKIIDIFHGFKIYRIPIISGRRWFNAIIYFLGALIALIILRKRYQIIHAHQLHTSGLIAGAAKYFLHSKKVIIKNCCGGEDGDTKNLSKFPFEKRLRTFMNKMIDQFIAISQETKDEMQKAGLGPITFISNGVDTKRFVSLASNDQRVLLRQELLGPHADKKMILFVGKFDPQKNIFVLLEAMKFIYQDAILLIIGEGRLRIELEKYVKEHDLDNKVVFGGITQEIQKFYQIADVFILPSRSEGLSNVLLEAMSSGLPSIGSDIAGIRDIIKHEINGLLVPLDNIGALASAITCVFSDSEITRRIGQRARADIVREFDIDAVTLKYATLYESLI